MTTSKGVYWREQPLLWCEDFSRDARHARRPRRSLPLAALVTLALTIATNVAMFSVLNTVLFDPLCPAGGGI